MEGRRVGGSWPLLLSPVEECLDGIRGGRNIAGKRDGTTWPAWILWQLTGKAMRAMAMVVTVAAMLARVGMTDMVEKRRKVDMDSMEVVDSVRVSREGGNMADRGSLDSELERLQRAIGLCNQMRSAMLEYAISCNIMIYFHLGFSSQ